MGACVLGASQAEVVGGEAVDGANVAHYWNDARLKANLPPLEIMHCAAHRGVLANKSAKDAFASRWQGLLLKHHYYFHESFAHMQELHKRQESLGLETLTPLRGTGQKWIGLAEAELQDMTGWGATKLFWDRRLAGQLDREQRAFAVSYHSFYSSLENTITAAGDG